MHHNGRLTDALEERKESKHCGLGACNEHYNNTELGIGLESTGIGIDRENTELGIGLESTGLGRSRKH